MQPILQANTRYLAHCGVETDLIFNHGIDLPHFSLFRQLETDTGRARLRGYAHRQIEIATQAGMGAVIETATWMANLRRAAPLEYDAAALNRINAAAVALLCDATENAPCPVVVSGNIGPSDDAYAPHDQLSPTTARAYHQPQIDALAGVDLIGAYTLAYPAEAAGMAEAARIAGLPIMLAFTVETDGRLPDGTPLQDAIRQCDDATGGYPEYYMINCAHPDHFRHILDGAPWQTRLKGLVVNASRCSHAELDNATALDEGNPSELGQQLAHLAQAHPALQVFGGCCGTDARHLTEMATSLSAQAPPAR